MEKILTMGGKSSENTLFLSDGTSLLAIATTSLLGLCTRLKES